MAHFLISFRLLGKNMTLVTAHPTMAPFALYSTPDIPYIYLLPASLTGVSLRAGIGPAILLLLPSTCEMSDMFMNARGPDSSQRQETHSLACPIDTHHAGVVGTGQRLRRQ